MPNDQVNDNLSEGLSRNAPADLETETAPPSRGIRRLSRSAIVRRALDIIRYDAQPLDKPDVDAEFDLLSWPTRFAETIRYNLACLEYATGANGWLRAYVRLNLRLLLFVLVPSAAVLILLAFLTPIFGSLTEICGLMEAGSKSLMMAAVYGLITLVIVSVIISAVVAIMGRK
jgi:hypothetical protein